MLGIQGQILEVTVVGCKKLKDTEWLSKQDPYVFLKYGSSKCRTKTHIDGGKAPIFQEKFAFSLIEGLTDINVLVWNSNRLSTDDFIGHGRVQLQKVLSHGYDDNSWSIQTKAGKYAGEVHLILHYPNAKNKTSSYHQQPTAPPTPYGVAPYGAPPPYNPPPATIPGHYPPAGYPGAYPQQPSYPGAYPQQPSYPPSMYPPAPDAYGGYPPPQGAYPPPGAYPPSGSHYYPPPGSYPPGHYPPY